MLLRWARSVSVIPPVPGMAPPLASVDALVNGSDGAADMVHCCGRHGSCRPRRGPHPRQVKRLSDRGRNRRVDPIVPWAEFGWTLGASTRDRRVADRGRWTWILRSPHARRCDPPTQTGQPPGVQSDGLAQPRQIPDGSLPATGTGATEEGGSISATATPRADLRTAPEARTVSPTASGERSTVPRAGGPPPTERHRLPARVTRYWRWRAFYSTLPLVVLLVSAAIVLPWGPWWSAGAWSASSLR